MAWQDDVLKIALANPDVIVPAEALGGKAKKRNKFGNVPTIFENIRFDSKAEMIRYSDLRLLELTGHISDLETQPVFELTAGVKYKGDFRYIENGQVIVEDVKGVQTRTFINKWKQVKFLFPDTEFRLVKK